MCNIYILLTLVLLMELLDIRLATGEGKYMRFVLLCVLFAVALAPCAVCLASEEAETANLGAKLIPVLGAATFCSLLATGILGFLLRRGRNVFRFHIGFA